MAETTKNVYTVFTNTEYIWSHNKQLPKDTNILEELSQHLDQLLVWLVKGSIEYFKSGLGNPPEAVINATKMMLSI